MNLTAIIVSAIAVIVLVAIIIAVIRSGDSHPDIDPYNGDGF